MSRYLFGGSSDDYAVGSDGRPVTNRRVRFYTSAAMTTEITDVASDAAGTGSPLTVTTNTAGFWGPVYGPDAVTVMYAGAVDSVGNPPTYVVAVYAHYSSEVASFNGRTGPIVLTKVDVTGTGLAATDVGADAAGAAAAAQAASAQKSANLSDLASAATARTNLGLGSAATQPTTAFDTAGAAATVQTNLTAETTRAQNAEAAITNGLKNVQAAVAATTNQALTGLPTVDGVTLTAGQVILLAGQTAGSQNGLWTVAVGAWARPSNFAAGADATGTNCWVEAGTSYASSSWIVTGTTNNVIGTNVLTWQQVSGLGEVTAAAPLTKTGNTLGLASSAAAGTYTAANVTIDAYGRVTAAANGASVAALARTGVKTAGYTAAAFDLVPVDTTSGAVAVTLPAAPADKSQVAIKHVTQGGTNAVTINRGGSDVFNKAGGSTSLTLTVVNQGVWLEYDAATAVWTVVADDLPLSGLDARYGALAGPNTWTGTQDFAGATVSGISGGTVASADAVMWVSGTGNDASSGLSIAAPKRTLQAAYAALPSTGGTIYVGVGRYDVLGGFALTRGKPVSLVGLVKPPPYISSTTTAPLSVAAAILYTSTNAASLVTTIGGTAGAAMNGLRFENLLFEFSGTLTTVGIDATTASYGEITGCYGFADKTTGPSPVTAQLFYVRADTTYGDSDASWWRVWNNRVMNMALGTFGNATGTKLSCNQQVAWANVGLGLTHTTTTTLPFLSFYGGHRCVERDNNIEAYYRGVLMDTCWMCTSDSSGGEFVDFFVDMVNTKGCKISPLGIAYAALGSNSATSPILQDAKLVRGDASTKANILILPSTWTAANTQRLYQPTDDPTHPAITMASSDNVIISPRDNANQGNRDLVGAGTPEGSVVGSIGDTYRRTDGGASTTLYVKESGAATNTGWIAYGASGGGASAISVVKRTVDSTITASTTLTADDTLKFAIGASDIWFFDGYLLVNAANTTMDMKVGLSGPASFTASWGNGDVAGATANPGFFSLATTGTPNAALGAAGVVTLGTATANLIMVHVAGWVNGGGTAGNVALTFAQNTSDAGNLVIKKGSHLKYYQLA